MDVKLLGFSFCAMASFALCAAESWNNQDWSGEELEFTSNTTITGGKVTGNGTITINGCTVTDEIGFGSNFTGTLIINNGGKLNYRIPYDTEHSFTAASKIILDNGELNENNGGVNLWTTNNIEIVSSDSSVTNIIYSNDANIKLNGNLSGSGTVLFQTWKRGVMLCGDNSEFSGVAVFEPLDGKWNSHGIWHSYSGSAKATFTLVGANNYEVDDWKFSMVLYEGTQDNPIHLGAFNVLDPEALVGTTSDNSYKTKAERSYLIIGEKNEDCVIEGGFNRAPVSITKAGSAVLRLGANFSCPADSTITVSSGTLVVDSDCPDMKIEVLNGATLTGSGRAYVTKLEPGCKVTGEVSVVFAGGQEKLLYDMDNIPFVDHTGSVIITNGTKVIWDGARFYENTGTSIFGSNPTIVFGGGCLRGFWKSNNQALYGEINVVAGTANVVSNEAANSLNGVNLHVKAKHTGSGSLSYHQKDRWIRFENGDNSGFIGDITITGASNLGTSDSDDSNATYFSSALAGFAKGAFTHNRASWLKFEHPELTTLAFGSLNVKAENTTRLFVKNANTTLQIGANNKDSVIEKDFTGTAFTLRKVGSGNLTMGAMVAGSSVVVAATDVEVDKLDTAKEYPLVSVPSSFSSYVDPNDYTADVVVNGRKKGYWAVRHRTDGDNIAYYLHYQPQYTMISVR